MALDASALSEEMRVAMGFPSPVSTQLLGWSMGVVEEVLNGFATFGNVPSPHPISGVTGAGMASLIANYAGYGFVTPQLLNFCTAVADHITGSGIVTYIGPPPAPPGLQPPDAWFLGGTISGLSGASMAADVAAAVGFPGGSPQLLSQCTVIANHIMANAQVVSGVIS